MPPPVLSLRGHVLRGHRALPGVVTIAGDTVVRGGGGRRVDLPPGWLLAPGLVDLQVNGFAGHEVCADPEGDAAVARALAAEGVTAFCPTLVSRDDAGYRRAARCLGAARPPAGGARSLGVHLEGPFLCPRRAGAHRPGWLVTADPGRVRTLLGMFRPRIVTLAPEVEGALAAVPVLVAAGTLVSLGHTEADAATVRRALGAGARMVTHALNAMPGLTARGPDGLAAALADPRVRIAAIGDGVHVTTAVLAALHALLGDRLVLVSDAVAAAGTPPGPSTLAGRRVIGDGEAVRTPEGTLAGSAAPLWHGIRTLRGAGIPLPRAVASATSAPRSLLGLPGCAPGDPADLVLLDPAGTPRWTCVGGVEAGHTLPDALRGYR